MPRREGRILAGMSRDRYGWEFMFYKIITKLVLHATSNQRGMIIGAIGLAAGFMLALVIKLSFGLMLAAAIWIIFGMPRMVEAEGRRRFAKVLYIPLPIIGTAVMLVVPTVNSVERTIANRPINPHVLALNADEAWLGKAQYTGDTALSQRVGEMMEISRPSRLVSSEPARVYTRHAGDRLLVLVKIEWLSELGDDMRLRLIEQISDVAWSAAKVPRDRVYIGVKGRLLYGAMQVDGKAVVQKFISEKRLAEFYEPAKTSTTRPIPSRTSGGAPPT